MKLNKLFVVVVSLTLLAVSAAYASSHDGCYTGGYGERYVVARPVARVVGVVVVESTADCSSPGVEYRRPVRTAATSRPAYVGSPRPVKPAATPGPQVIVPSWSVERKVVESERSVKTTTVVENTTRTVSVIIDDRTVLSDRSVVKAGNVPDQAFVQEKKDKETVAAQSGREDARNVLVQEGKAWIKFTPESFETKLEADAYTEAWMDEREKVPPEVSKAKPEGGKAEGKKPEEAKGGDKKEEAKE